MKTELRTWLIMMPATIVYTGMNYVFDFLSPGTHRIARVLFEHLPASFTQSTWVFLVLAKSLEMPFRISFAFLVALALSGLRRDTQAKVTLYAGILAAASMALFYWGTAGLMETGILFALQLLTLVSIALFLPLSSYCIEKLKPTKEHTEMGHPSA